MRKGAILLLICLFFYHSKAQNQEQWLEEILEMLLENQTVESDRSDLELSIKEWLKHPIHLNKASSQDLEVLFFLKPNQIHQIINHRNSFGPFLSKYELQAVQGLTANDIFLLSKFCEISEQNSHLNGNFLNTLQTGNHEIIVQHRREFETPEPRAANYAGSLDYLSLRYRFQYKTNWYMGFGLEKDPGEKWNIFGDFQTYHLLYKGTGLIKTLALGDYHINMGKGLCVGSSHFSGKSSLVFQTQILQSGIRPSRSLSEMGFMRGIGLSLHKKNKQLDVWLSASPISANVIADSLLQTDYLSGILLSGLHRTPQELSKKNAAIQQSYGFHFTLINPRWQWGIIFQKRAQVSRLNFGSNQNMNELLLLNKNVHGSNYGTFQWNNISFQYEIACQNWTETAILLKTIIPLHSKLDALFLYRNYAAQYSNPAANGWSAQSNLGNEKGSYLALVYKPKKGQTISFYADAFQTQAASYQKFKPALGSDMFIMYQISFGKNFQVETRYRNISSERDQSSKMDNQIIQMESFGKHQARIQITYQFHESWRYLCRLEWVKAQNSQGEWKQGSLLYHDINLQPKNSKWRFRARYCVYQVSDYAARIYMPESDLPLNYANRMFQKNGYYVYFLGSYRMSKMIDIQIKYAFNYLPEDQLKESRWQEFESASEHIFKGMIRFRF